MSINESCFMLFNNWEAMSVFFVLAWTTFIAFYVLFNNITNSLNRTFTLMAISLVIWTLQDFVSITSLVNSIGYSIVFLSQTGGIFTGPTSLHFMMVLSNEVNNKILFLAYGSALLIAIGLLTSPLFVSHIAIYSTAPNYGIKLELGFLYYLFIVFIAVNYVYGIFVLIKALKKSLGNYRSQIKSVFTAYVFAISSALIYFPSVFGITVPRIDNILVGICFTIIAYSIVKYQLMAIEIAIKRSFIYSLMVAIITAVYVGLISIFGGVLKGVFGQGHLTTAIVSGIFIAFGFFPLRNFLANATDRFFFQKSYNYRKTLQELSKTLSNEIDLNKVMKLLMEAFLDTIKVKSAEIVMLNWNTGEYVCRKCADNRSHKLGECVMSDQSALIKLLSSCQSIIPLEDLDSIVKSCFIKHKRKNKVSAADLPKMLEIIRQECNALDAQLIVPMFHRGQLSGFFVLGEKLSEDAFSATDKEMLEIIAYHAGTVIENARLYEKEKLRVKELTLLYNVGWGINSSILTDSFYNNILTIVRDAIGCDRAFLAIVNNDSLLQYVAVDNKDVTLDHIQYITKKVDVGVYEKIFASGSPLILPSSEYRQLKLTHEEQAIFKFGREIMLVPLMFKKKTIGLLSVDNNHSRKTLSKLNLNLIMSVASQMALAIENINLNNVAMESQKIAAESERMAALGTMTAGLAHEIRNPMVALKTFTDLFPERVNDPEYQRKYIEIVPPEVKRVNDLVSEMLALSRTQKLMLIPTSLSDVIRSVANLIEPELQAQNVSFIFSPPEELIIQASTDQLKQVFLNLFRNAVEAMPKGGSLAVSFQKFKKINKVEITVSDTGIGIEKEKIAHVFEPFYTTRHEGTGLGLAITHKIVEDHSGQIAVDSVQYQGTTFTIKLPISQE